MTDSRKSQLDPFRNAAREPERDDGHQQIDECVSELRAGRSLDPDDE